MSKYIYLTRGQRAVVDDEDYDKVIELGPWTATPRRDASTGRFLGFYASKSIYEPFKQTIYIHNIVMGGKGVTFVNGNTLDCRKRNLIFASRSVIRNRAIKKLDPIGSKYKGIRKALRGGKWEARIKINGKSMCLGYFLTEKEAHEAYNKKALELYGLKQKERGGL